MKAHLLYVEDDASLSFVTRDNLEMNGYKITCCMDGRQAMEVVKNERFDLCILDVMLPEVDGFTIAKEIRKYDAEVPILFLSAKSLKEDRIEGLRIGGDDYLTKPFSIEELLLKVEIFLRRRHMVAPQMPKMIRIGQYLFDYTNLTLEQNGELRRLTQREADLLRYLMSNRGQVIRRSAILEQIWGEDDYFLGRSLDVFISRLRKYLQKDEGIKIENVHGIGFQFVCPE
ncbi:response regulator transcription factor [Haliscomenobacter sp.]|jgi:two-component system, OmpR family, response regulator VicR|uniref:response regulator transcription factor n=1 Tax=Haliscomenobacter sp. TaxID=2717303 RepID=UPI003BAD6423